jgi:hypothetical protein
VGVWGVLWNKKFIKMWLISMNLQQGYVQKCTSISERKWCVNDCFKRAYLLTLRGHCKAT